MKAEESELFDDRAISEALHDRFGHQHVAEELIHLIKTVPTPANIALYGRWGTGKSSLANLLAQAAKEDEALKFVRYDAFKWAEMPLRRHFIAQVAGDLGIKDRKYFEGLYQSEETVWVELPSRDAVWAGLKVVGSIAAVVILAIAAVSYYSGEDVASIVRHVVSLTGSASVIALVVGLVAFFGGHTLPIRRKSSAPSSDEQFERLFKDLVDKIQGDRLVVFIDELDRCSASEVVATLESIKTFLGIERCVFIVAADRGVLELALSQRARQLTPEDMDNPYYSSGSEYLDKVFHYQATLPPLMPQRLSAYAKDLVRNRGGLWAEVDQAQVIPVLIPTHVRSPRRVKALLNNYAITYRIARQRSEKGAIDGGLVERASEIAKLVSLRMEFPLFAEHLEVDDRLCDWVPEVYLDNDLRLPPTMSSRVQELVRRYARAEMPVDQQMGGTAANRKDNNSELITSSAQEASAEPPEAGEESKAVDDATSMGARPRSAEHAHGIQLVRYLQKTRFIPGPKRDLIFLESSGIPYNLDPAFADSVESAAVDGNAQEFSKLVSELPANDQVAALQMIAVKARHTSGVEARNSLHSLFVASREIPAASLDATADEILDAVSTNSASINFESDDLLGVLRLALASKRDRSELVSAALDHPGTTEESEIIGLLLPAYSRLLTLGGAKVAEITGYWLSDVRHAPNAWSLVGSLDSEDRAAVVGGAADAIRRRLQALAEADPQKALGVLTSGLEVFHQRRFDRELEELLLVGLRVESDTFWDEILDWVGDLDHVERVDVARAIVTVTARRPLNEWTVWLKPLLHGGSSNLLSANETQALADSLIASIQGDWESTGAVEALASLESLLRGGADLDRSEASKALRASLAEVSWSSVDYSSDDRIMRNAARICEHGIANPEAMSQTVETRLRHFLELVGAQAPSAEAAKEFVGRWTSWVAKHGQRDAVDRTIDSLDSCPWLPSPQRELAVARMASLAHSCGKTVPFPYTTPKIVSLKQEGHQRQRGDVASIIGYWLELAEPSVEEAQGLVASFALYLPPTLEKPLQKYSSKLTPADNQRLLWPTLEKALSLDISKKFLNAAGIKSLNGSALANLLARLYRQATRNKERRRVLDILSTTQLDSTSRKQVFEEVVVPAIGENKGSLEAVLDNWKVIKDPPHGTKGSTEKALDRALRSHPSVYKKHRETLDQLGFVRKSLLDRLRNLGK